LPYLTVEDLPLPIQAHLPLHAQEIYLGAFNSAWTQYGDRGPEQRESTAHRVAWAAAGFHASPTDGRRLNPAAGSRRASRLIPINIAIAERCH